MIICIFILCVIGIAGYSYFVNRMKGLPPGPPPLPLIGNTHQLTWIGINEKLVEWKKKYGRVFTIWTPTPTVVLSDHELLQKHIVKDGDRFAERLNRKAKAKIVIGGEYGLFFNDNSIWKEQRQFALYTLRDLGFTSATTQRSLVDFSQVIISKWKQQGAGKRPVDVSRGIMVGISNIIWPMIFGRSLSYDDPLVDHLEDLLHKFVKADSHPALHALEFIPAIKYLDRFIGSPIQKYRDLNKILVDLVLKEIANATEEINEDEQTKCFAESFIREMRRREEKGEDLTNYSQSQLVASCFDLWFAGYETTLTTLRFMIHYMITHPAIQRKAQEEIDLHIGKRSIYMEDQKNLHYCNAVIQEIQRLANVGTVNFPRRVCESVTIEGFRIPVGTGVIPEFYIVHLDENEFENPHLFWPERHINDHGEFVKDPRITPFSIGKRSCLGEGLARMELFIYFTSFIQHLTFSSVTKVPPPLNLQINFIRSPAPFDVLIESRE